jgi:transposase
MSHMAHKKTTLEQRRLRGGRLLSKGLPQAEVARRLGVSPATVSAWKKRLDAAGPTALRDQRRGRPSGLDGAERTRLAALLKKGALSQGYTTNVWTLSRIGRLIVKEFGLEYSDSQVSRILATMGGETKVGKPTKRRRRN